MDIKCFSSGSEQLANTEGTIGYHVNKLNRLIILGFSTVFLLSLTVGCAQDDEISVRKIPKGRSGLTKLRQDSKTTLNSDSASVSHPTRMVVAIFQNPEATWFFKVSGPSEQVAASEGSWKSFFETVSFDGNTPSWEMPSDWATGAEKPMRYATLKIGSFSPPLEMSISSLGPNQDLLLNANRWLGQIGLPPTTSESLDATIEPIKNEKSNFLLFDRTGRGSGKMTPPFAGGARPPRQPSPPTAQPPAQDVKFETPAGWDAGPTNSMVKVRLLKEADGKKAQISVIEMPASANTWEPNVLRWQQQVGLGGLSESELSDRVADISVDGVAGKIVDLIDMNSDSDDGTIAAMVKLGDSAWFLKLSGDKNLVDANRDSFKSFLKTLKLK
eukprot:COSAG01_NODE_2265_length_8044_cov_8.813845_2_plen_386_part_00